MSNATIVKNMKSLYDHNKITISKLKAAVKAGLITPADYFTITGEQYSE